jgi:hypothetical protein
VKDLPDRRAIARGDGASDFDRPSILEQAQLDRRNPVTVADRRDRKIDPRVVQHRFGSGDAQHLAIPSHGQRSHPDGKHRDADVSASPIDGARISAVGQQHHPGDGLTPKAFRRFLQRAREIAARR